MALEGYRLLSVAMASRCQLGGRTPVRRHCVMADFLGIIREVILWRYAVGGARFDRAATLLS